MNPTDIDFVLLWVDGADPAWREEFNRYRREAGMDASEVRYRDWGLLRYWFRGVERFAPWVRRIHFITWGHLPVWLDCSHPKLRIVRHADYIPAEWLPTFNSNVIELNIPRIGGELAEHFVLFNDDTLLTRPCRPEDFFRRGLPCDMARLSIVRPSCIAQTVLNDLALIDRVHPRSDLNRHLAKWLSPRYGFGNLCKTLSLLPWSFFPGFFDPHMPQPYRRSAFERAWEVWGSELAAACRNRFRAPSDLSHWLVRYDTLCRGEFVPRGFADTLLSDLDDRSIERVCREVAAGRRRMVCLNDSTDIADFEHSRRRLEAAFEELLPDRSTYEIR